MIPAFHRVLKSVTPAAIVDNAAFTTAEVDSVDATLGKAHHVSFIVYFGAMDIAATVLKVTESDTAGSGHVDISGADFSVSPATLPSATSDNTFFVVNIDLKNAARKRYFDCSLTGGDGAAGTYAVVIGELWFPTISPTSAATTGAAQMLSV